jgi:hypothetical protein
MLGVLPLTIATGAGANSRQSIGTTVLGGMIGSATMDQLVVPVFFVMILSVTARFGPKRPSPIAASSAHTTSSEGDPPPTPPAASH